MARRIAGFDRSAGGGLRSGSKSVGVHGPVDLMRRWSWRFAWLPLALPENAREEAAGVGLRVAGDLLGRAGGDDFAALVAAFGAEVDQPVGGLDDVEIVLDDHAARRRIRAACGKRRAAWRCRRNAGRWWARRGCRGFLCFRCASGARRA